MRRNLWLAAAAAAAVLALSQWSPQGMLHTAQATAEQMAQDTDSKEQQQTETARKEKPKVAPRICCSVMPKSRILPR